MPKAADSPSAATRIRKATAADLPAIERIEREQFSNPWSIEYYSAELENSLSHFFVAEEEGAVVGYLLFWRLGAELELHKIAVASVWQRHGHAARLMEFFIRAGCEWGCERAILEVRESNAAAIALYEKYAFRRVGLRNGYYARPAENALVFELIFREAGKV